MYKKRILFAIEHNTNNELILKTINMAISENINSKPIIHSEQEYQYTPNIFKKIRKTRNDSKYVSCIKMFR